MKKMDNKGFSLVELIIVIAIMAILVGVLAPQFIKYVEQSRQSTDLQTINEIKTAVETYVTDFNPSEDVTVTADGKKVDVTGGATVASLSQYGITSDNTKLKSNKSTVKWVYGASTYTWTGTASATSGQMYDFVTGSKKEGN
jgi:type IV pilus assembly protein PilA